MILEVNLCEIEDENTITLQLVSSLNIEFDNIATTKHLQYIVQP